DDYPVSPIDTWAGMAEIEALESIPQPYRDLLVQEAMANPELIGDFVIPLLRTENPFATLMGCLDSSRPTQEFGEFGAIPAKLRALVDAKKKKVAEAAAAAKKRSDELLKTQGYYTLPWYTQGKPVGLSNGWAFQTIAFWRWMVQYLQKHGPNAIPEPSLSTITGPGGKTGRGKGSPHASWMEAQFRAFGQNRFPQPPAGTPERAEWDMAWKRASSPGGLWGAITRGLRRVGGIIVSIAGAVLAPFTGGASVAAAAVLGSALKAWNAQQAASAAKQAASQNAALLQGQADAQTAALAAQIEKFYQDNQAWFLQNDITPAKWAQLTLQQKIDVINSAAKGTPLPAATPVAATPVAAPPGYAPPEAPADAPAPPAGAWTTREELRGAGFDLIVEGQRVGSFTTLEAASRAALGMTQPGDRFEVIAQGRPTGLRVRTSTGSVDVPPDLVEKVLSLPREKMAEFVRQGEKDVAAKAATPFPWWILAAGGAALLLR
ncbi:MAG: hypothetical protein ACRDZ4_17535, partial [Egibacteraceae bacterium]